MKLIVGLGNPGKRYEKTRHNIGFMVVDTLRASLAEADKINDWELSKKFNAKVCGCTLYGHEKIILAKPMTFMNGSGEAIQLLMHYYQIIAGELIVVHDDKDLKLGAIKIQTGRGHAGHNGVRSIMEHIGTEHFTRVRVGIASENEKKMKDVAKFVLKKFNLLERKKAEEAIGQGAEEIKKLIM